MTGTSIVILLTIHTVVSTFFLVDLYSVSQRQNKFQWFIMLAFVPFFSAIMYNKSKKRNKEHNA